MAVDFSDPNLTITAGLDLLDNTNTLIESIDDDFVGGRIVRNGFRTIHSTCQLEVSRKLLWTSQRVRPNMTVTDSSGNTATYNLGVYVLTTPARPVGESPELFRVTGYDLLYVLDKPYGSAYTADSGDAYITEAETIIEATGNLVTNIDQTSVGTTLAADLSWELDNKNTYLRIASDLLEDVGYDPLYADRNGEIVSVPYQAPSGITPTVTVTSSMVERMEQTNDTHDIPNKWVGFISDVTDTTAPAEGTGIYTLTNQSDGETSVDSRGYTVTRLISTEAASQADLVDIVSRQAEIDRQALAYIKATTPPLLDLWHRDVVTVNVPERGSSVPAILESFTLDMLTGRMDTTLRRYYAV